MTSRLTPAVPAWRLLAIDILPAYVASRIVLIGVVLVIAGLPLPWARATYADGPLLAGLTGHDAVYYLGIAADGYHLAPVSGQYTDWVFFPMFPIVTRLVSTLLAGNVALAGVLVANAALFLALLVVGRLAAGTGVSPRLVSWFVAFAPGAVAFGLAYSDSLYLALAAGALYAARSRRYALMALGYSAATLCRAPGVLLAIPLAIELAGRSTAHRPRMLAWLLVGPIAIAAFALYQGAVLGDPLAFVHGQAAWNIAPAISGSASSGSGGTSVTSSGGPADWYVGAMIALLVVTLLSYTATLPSLVRSRLPRSEAAVAVVAFASVFISGRLQSDARYLAVGWSFATFFAIRRRKAITGIALAVSGTLYVIYAVLNVSQLLAP